MIGFTGSLAPDDVCANVQKIEDAFKRTVNELLHCVAESIYGYREREHREACVLHMRTAIQDRHIDSIGLV
ncbi:hypothetical protein MAR_004237 [Mya arenaria]|uniref:Uncharacterized protein n=1 Tax=Mya arenaria TaxID=6604 RepID=A0ABY7EXV5_MYAAR|nr:hypothetical protein MAR_004237 [Mya arenaria]